MTVKNLATNPYKTVVKEFETAVAKYAGAPFAVAVDTCTDAIFLCLEYLKYCNKSWPKTAISMPSQTYCSVANAVIHAGYSKIRFTNEIWRGDYELKPTGIIDSALRFRYNMYNRGEMRCLSFQYRKHIPIGRGGMILLDNRDACEWLKLARFNGRPEMPLDDKSAEPQFPGWLCHMEPERAARGLNFMMHVKDYYDDLVVNYPPLHKMKCYEEYIF